MMIELVQSEGVHRPLVAGDRVDGKGTHLPLCVGMHYATIAVDSEQKTIPSLTFQVCLLLGDIWHQVAEDLA